MRSTVRLIWRKSWPRNCQEKADQNLARKRPFFSVLSPFAHSFSTSPETGEKTRSKSWVWKWTKLTRILWARELLARERVKERDKKEHVLTCFFFTLLDLRALSLCLTLTRNSRPFWEKRKRSCKALPRSMITVHVIFFIRPEGEWRDHVDQWCCLPELARNS